MTPHGDQERMLQGENISASGTAGEQPLPAAEVRAADAALPSPSAVAAAQARLGVLIQLPALQKIVRRVPVIVIGKSTAVAKSGKRLGHTAREIWLSKQSEARARSLANPYRALLMMIHRMVFDRPVEQLFFRPTREWIRLSQLHIPAAARERSHDHFPTPRLTFEWALRSLPGGRERSLFIDHGAGRGRALLMACAWPFEKAIGVEFSPELAEDCRMNVAQFPRSRMRCRDVECICADMLDYTPPAQEAVHYFLDPVEPQAFLEVTGRIAASAKAGGHVAWIVCVGMDRDADLTAQGYTAVSIPLVTRMKLALFSPYRVSIFRTPIAEAGTAASAHA